MKKQRPASDGSRANHEHRLRQSISKEVSALGMHSEFLHLKGQMRREFIDSGDDETLATQKAWLAAREQIVGMAAERGIAAVPSVNSGDFTRVIGNHAGLSPMAMFADSAAREKPIGLEEVGKMGRPEERDVQRIVRDLSYAALREERRASGEEIRAWAARYISIDWEDIPEDDVPDPSAPAFLLWLKTDGQGAYWTMMMKGSKGGLSNGGDEEASRSTYLEGLCERLEKEFRAATARDVPEYTPAQRYHVDHAALSD